MTITGRGGVDLHQVSGNWPYAYLGITVPQFPNFFVLYGPGAHLAHGGSLIFTPTAMRYINSCLANLARPRCIRSNPPPSGGGLAPAHPTGNQADGVGTPKVKHSYFKNAEAIHTVSPWRLNEYWAAAREPDWSAFVFRTRS